MIYKILGTALALTGILLIGFNILEKVIPPEKIKPPLEKAFSRFLERDLTIENLGQMESQSAFTDTGRANYGNQVVHFLGRSFNG